MSGEKFIPALKVPRECPLVFLVEYIIYIVSVRFINVVNFRLT